MFKPIHALAIGVVCLATFSCKVPAIVSRNENKAVPNRFESGSTDTLSAALLPYKTFFSDPLLVNLVDTALRNNQDLKMALQEIEIARSEIRMRHGAILPSVSIGGGVGLEKVGRYTSQGAGDASTDIEPGKEVPDILPDFRLGAVATWEADIWKKLRTAKQAAVSRYLATVEGRNFVITSLISEVANSYYELQAMDAQLATVRQNIALQQNALSIVRVQKEAARATELAVKKFEAEVLKSQSLEFDILQDIKATENNINFLLGRFPQPIPRSSAEFLASVPPVIKTGVPSQLLTNRPDIRQAELELTAAKLDVKVARAEFLPSFGMSAALGFQAFKPAYLVKLPESILFSLAGDLAAPLINRNALFAEFNGADARQQQKIFDYERTVLNAYIEVSTQLSAITNLQKSYELKSQQVDALNKGIDAANDLFKAARADYLEVLMTQRDVLDAKLELIETKKQQFTSVVSLYRHLGGGWK